MFFREIIHLRQRPETEKRVRLLGFRDFPNGFPWWLRWQRICLQCKRSGFHSSVRKIPWRREWLPTPIFLPGEFHEQRSLAGPPSPGDRRVGHDWGTLTFKDTQMISKHMKRCSTSLIIQFSSAQSLSRVRLFATPWTTARQASLSITNSWSSLRSIESVMPSNHLILCRPLLLLPPISPSIRVFSYESTLRMR